MLLAGVEHNLVSFDGDVTVSNIEQARAELGTILSQDGPVVVDIDGVTETDLTFIQLIESARRKAAETGSSLTLRHAAGGPVLEVLQRGGFLHDETSDRATFWLQGADQ